MTPGRQGMPEADARDWRNGKFHAGKPRTHDAAVIVIKRERLLG